ncbi:MAG TPA: RIP metalloprotease RseP [Myxococcota bacterium]|nr:RIP metalloprotease RseP [Myxococcota bacterium]
MNLPALVDHLVPFVLLLGVLIFIHELGHFAVAKWLGVKVEKFSIGFGPSLFARRVGETDYVIAALPLGGFVKMLGEIPGEELAPEEVSRAFNARPVWQRIAIALAGPVMNLVLPVFLIAAILMTGLPTLTSRVGTVVPGSAAARAGIHDGDRIVAAGGESLWRWIDLQEKLQASGAPGMPLTIERANGERAETTLVREKDDGGAWKDMGLQWQVPEAVVGVTGPQTPAALAGLETGDRVTAVNGAPVSNLRELRQQVAAARPPLELDLERPLDGQTEKIHVTLRGASAPGGDHPLESLGLAPVGVSLGKVHPDTPAARAGLQAGDVVLSVGGDLVSGVERVRDLIRNSGGEPLAFVLLRDHKLVQLEVTPAAGPDRNGQSAGNHYQIGVELGLSDVGAEYKDDVVRNPFLALGRGVARTADLFAIILGGIFQLITGSVGMSSLSGPIGIGEIAADAYQTSWTQFVWLMALISVNLAILNLLPIPVLDGGQIALAAAEGIKGSPLPARARDIAQTVGLSLILLLMGVAFWNDIARHWSGVVSFLTDLG